MAGIKKQEPVWLKKHIQMEPPTGKPVGLYSVVMQEVPGEISLALNITECPHHCPGCHSPELAESIGDYLDDKLPELLDLYGDMITCVCFMGGDQHPDGLLRACEYIHNYDPTLGLAIYSGADMLDDIGPAAVLMDYIKLGPYVAELGGLDCKTTNQVMFKKVAPGRFQNITETFWRKPYETQAES